MKIKTVELTGPALDWAVERIEIAKMLADGEHVKGWWVEEKQTNPSPYSTDCLFGWPVIEREGIAIRKHSSGTWYAMLSTDLGDGESAKWSKVKPGTRYGKLSYEVNRVQCRFEGPISLIAAMRCFVASKLGDEVEVPDELCEVSG